MLARWPAFYQAVGLAAASVSVYVPIGFAIYMLMTVFFLNQSNKDRVGYAYIMGITKKV